MSLSPRLLGAYRRTVYSVDGVELRIGQRSPAMDALLRRHRAREAVLVTAWNPMSRRMPIGWNRRAQRRLMEHLRQFAMLEAAGGWRQWREDHVLVFAPSRRVVRLAGIFRQAAVVIIGTGRTPALVVRP